MYIHNYTYIYIVECCIYIMQVCIYTNVISFNIWTHLVQTVLDGFFGPGAHNLTFSGQEQGPSFVYALSNPSLWTLESGFAAMYFTDLHGARSMPTGRVVTIHDTPTGKTANLAADLAQNENLLLHTFTVK